MKYEVNKITIFPIKSLSGISVNKTFIDNQGLANDRKYMIVEKDNQGDYTFLSQRKDSLMSQIHVKINESIITLSDEGYESIDILSCQSNEIIQCTVWDSKGTYRMVNDNVNKRISRILGRQVYIVECIASTNRLKKGMDIGCRDRSPISIIFKPSINDCESEFGRSNYRCNITLSGDVKAYTEPCMIGKSYQTVSGACLTVERPISRCPIITNDPDSSQFNKNVFPFLIEKGVAKPLMNMYGKEKRGLFVGVGGFFDKNDQGKEIKLGEIVDLVGKN